MFECASDFATLIQLLVGGFFVTIYFLNKEKNYLDDEYICALRDAHNFLTTKRQSSLPKEYLTSSSWNLNWYDRIKKYTRDHMLSLLLYGIVSLYYCSCCARIDGKVMINGASTCGIVIYSILMFFYQIFITVKYGYDYKTR